jgi:SAM-dependent methyltransferase
MGRMPGQRRLPDVKTVFRQAHGLRRISEAVGCPLKQLLSDPAVNTVGIVTADLFDAAAMYDDDYLHFFASSEGDSAPTHGPVVGTAYAAASATDMVWRLLDLQPGMSVLDLACGHGALANALAARGCEVTGLDSSAVFLDRARTDAGAMAVDVEYVSGDMRQLPAWTGRFDRLVNWTTAFGYFDDRTNRNVLAEMVRVLRPGGRMAMDLDNLPRFLASYTPSRITASRDNGDMLVDRHHFDPLTGRFEVERTVVRDGQARRLTFLKRLFGFPELRDWCTAAGFTIVAGYGEDGEPLNIRHHRMIVIAELP